MAAAVPPIDVHCVHAGPDAPVQGPAAHPLVVATAVLRWGPVAAAPSGAARVQLPHHAMLRVFGRRLRLAAPSAGTPAPMVCPLDLALTGTAWARFLNELLTCGLLDAAPFSSSAALQLAIDRLDVSPAALEVEGDAPWTVIAYLSGMLGPCLGQAERDRAGSQDYVLALEGALPPSLCAPALHLFVNRARSPASLWRAQTAATAVAPCANAAGRLAPSWALTRHPTVGATQLNDWVNSG
ncbi:hypothetical protein EMIHUDRAFT_202972 [Emiliania huxleyi CCMP1516]|uniref:Uncharacterized protein n=2 Tax=Emiliania huxleyi TaxID=2903 RepID=A0A0D3K5A0_EMIH1|nr:hypothetical protein EMIHUDRAFT_202972 [Emiliania huxleyi CCMP1516]EOD30935.1 hypothetical protein EMIHUDRAFT_202972 [Emiliania huxleyi CCMP1516]|eukprot:XP_005783364.1 hypothetical protein EMIHUDRAFT_202972 [Emiliania huxleyi CCMP1516]